jgi:hypothetical protein
MGETYVLLIGYAKEDTYELWKLSLCSVKYFWNTLRKNNNQADQLQWYEDEFRFAPFYMT